MIFKDTLVQFLENLPTITVGFALLFSLIALLLKPEDGKKKDLEFIINKALAGSALPTGLALIGCAFKPELLEKLDGASLNVAVAGITLIFISIKSVFVKDK